MDVEIIMAHGAMGADEFDTKLDVFLREFAKTHKCENPNDSWSIEKYGVHYVDEKFVMHPYCWCGMEDCPYCGFEEGQPSKEIIEQTGWDSEHCSAPNFWYKPLNFKVRWYKYIGRSVETNRNLTEDEFKQMEADANCQNLQNNTL